MTQSSSVELPKDVRTAVALRSDQVEFDQKQIDALHMLGVKGANRAELAVFFHQCKRTQLDPFARQIYMIRRMVWDSDSKQFVPRQTIQTGIDGFRLIARRAADRAHESLAYEDTLYCGPDGKWVDVWLDEEHPPAAARVVVLRNGNRFPAVALFREYKATRKVVKQGKEEIVLTGQWVDKPAIMIAKCAEALALRKAFPQDLSGLYTDDEMESGGDSPQLPPPTNAVVEGEVVDAATGEVRDGDALPPDVDEPAADAKPSEQVDWKARIEQADSIDALNAVWQGVNAAGAKTTALTRTFTKRGREFAEAARAQAESAK